MKESEGMSLGSTSENLIAFESVSTPLGSGVGVIGDASGGEKIREEGVGEGLDASVAGHSRYSDGRRDPTECEIACQLTLSGRRSGSATYATIISFTFPVRNRAFHTFSTVHGDD